ncbi:hypothetical protein [Kineococcus arenarius]|uniref:hypothetical protein n=1 Tax=Kineococcus sp. SYSU DK007 TaxID=3383128 RepID=UPI003D7EE216
MQPAPVFFDEPDGELIELRIAPRLASWMASGHPDQVRLEKFLVHAEDELLPRLAQLPDPVALRLDVGLEDRVDLLEQHDLDNYAFPLAVRLTQASGRQLSCVWVTKRHAATSAVGVQQAVTRNAPSTAGQWVQVRTTASASTTAYKQQIHDQLCAAVALPEGPVAMEVSFTVGPRRNWLNLWKPTIDALEALLGRSLPERAWHPRDGRIVRLGLHHHVDAAHGHDVSIAIAAAVLQ